MLVRFSVCWLCLFISRQLEDYFDDVDLVRNCSLRNQKGLAKDGCRQGVVDFLKFYVKAACQAVRALLRQNVGGVIWARQLGLELILRQASFVDELLAVEY